MIRRMISALLVLALLLSTFALADYHVLDVGSKDSADDWSVYSLQTQLIELGYLSGTADGVYGNGTAKAVKNFQASVGLEPTGVADEQTQEQLFGTKLAPDATPTPRPAQIYTNGSKGTDVSILQNYLYVWGFTEYAPDGSYGKNTVNAVTRFQKYSESAMNDFLLVKARVTPEPTPDPTPDAEGMFLVDDVKITPEPTANLDGSVTPEWFEFMQSQFDPHCAELALDSTGDDVKRMQRRLYGLKYIASGIDGAFGKHTQAALTYFQHLNGLPETGVLDRATQDALFSDHAVESDKVVSLYKAMVSVKDQRVYIYKWTGTDYTALEHTFVCSTGTKENPTILGTFQATGRCEDWYYMADSRVWVRYAFIIQGNYFFHSVLFSKKGDKKPTSGSVSHLGRRASHGCIRLSVEDAKWIYENCENGMTVTIYED